jgi:hypothetical protein
MHCVEKNSKEAQSVMLLLLKLRHWSAYTAGRMVPATDREDRLGEGKAANIYIV